MKFDTVVVGGGIAGLTAAAYIAREGRTVALIEKQYKTGGLVQTFERNGVYFDGGLRSIENSGIVFPMLRQLGIEVDFVKSPVSIGIADTVLKLKGKESLTAYENLLIAEFPDQQEDVKRIVKEIRKIMGYMDVLYGIDNPAFLNMTEDKEYLMKTILPWLFKFLLTVRNIERLKEPVNDYLSRLTNSQALIDNIAQHFFQKTPTSFALSYFHLYLDYHYPKGGTAVLIEKMTDFITQKGGIIKTSTTVTELHPEKKYIVDQSGNKIEYKHLVWAGDMKMLYNIIPLESLTSKVLKQKIEAKKELLKDMKGGDSVFTVYLTANEHKEYFDRICTGHFFYTPSKVGLSQISNQWLDEFLALKDLNPNDEAQKNNLKEYLTQYCDLNTFEISIPALRDSSLAPEGKTGLIISLLFDYSLTKRIDELGWSEDIKHFMETSIIRVLSESIYPGLESKVADCFSSSPLTIERLTGNTQGGITGWAFTNPIIPVVNKTMKVAKSVKTILPSVFQAGQWTYSPAGFPISVLTGKLAADKVLAEK